MNILASLAGKVVLITGGTGGIGRAAAVAFAGAGAHVVVCGRREEEGKVTVARIREAGSEGLFVHADVSKSADVRALVAEVVSKFGRLDIAFNNAGVEGGIERLHKLTEEDYDRVFGINVKGLWLCLCEEIKQFLAQGDGGVIINNSSVQGHISWGLSAHYTASKHAVEGYTKTAAIDYAKKGIRVNAIAPAIVNTEMTDAAFAGKDEAAQGMRALHPLGRFADMDEVVAAVLFLASDKASYINGVSLPVDGGMLCN